jgi:hypothetical protein
MLGVLLLGASVLIAAGEYYGINSSTNVAITVTDAGDTAHVMKLDQFTAKDSFQYNGDIEGYGDGAYPGLGALDSAYTWTSPPMIVRLDITSPIESASVYYCTLDCGTNVYGYTYDPPGTDTTVATFSAAMVDSINNVAGMKDTIAGEDSIANGYVLARWKVAMDGLEGDARGVIRVGDDQAGGELAIGDSTLVTMAMVCDSMAATINALDSINLRLTAANDGDSVITLTSDKKGVAFTVDVADTSMDTTTITANKTSKSRDSIDTYIGNTYGYRTMHAKFMLSKEQSAYAGLGNSDSAWIHLYGVMGTDLYLIARDSNNALPCSLLVTLHSNVGDTIIRPGLMVRTKVTDTCTDTVMEVNYPISWDIHLK